MENYSGKWVGEMHGTNFGIFDIDLTQEGQMLRGRARFREPQWGNYECTVEGIVAEKPRLKLTPVFNPNALSLGPVDVVVNSQANDHMAGTWHTIRGRHGSFTAHRDSHHAPPITNPASPHSANAAAAPSSAQQATGQGSGESPAFASQRTVPHEEKQADRREEKSTQTFSIGGKIAPAREAKERELCLDIDAYANAIADTFSSAADEDDFVFALYGSWGRGKSTLIKRVAHVLTNRALTKLVPNYLPVTFSAWKYPTRPEVWVHLYERMTKASHGNSFWQKQRIGFRIGLQKNGWTPLILGCAFLALSRLQIDFAHWLFEGLGVIGLLIVGSFAWNATKLGKQFAHSYFAMPSHGDKLGLQAVIGEDLKHLLNVWTNPSSQSNAQLQKQITLSDFSQWGPARYALIAVVSLIWLTLALVAWKIALHSALPSPERPALFLTPANLLYGTLVGLALAALAWALALARKPHQCERVLLIVDDLDRCEPSQMLAVIESLRLFLDDDKMSRRLQVAMLIDRRILFQAIINRAKDGKLLEQRDTGRTFFREQEEKLFVVSMELPPLNTRQVSELAARIVNGAYHEQIEAKISAAKASIAKLDFGELSGTLGALVPPMGKEAIWNPAWEERRQLEDYIQKSQDELKTIAGATSDSGSPPSLDDTPDSDLTFSNQERLLLARVVDTIPAGEVTPRSYRSFVLRYQLARLILHRLKEPFEPSAVVDALCARLLKGNEVLKTHLGAVVTTAVNSVAGFEEGSD